jgi:hypothetical protein
MPATVTAPSYIHGTSYYVTWTATATSYNVQRTNLDQGVTIIVATDIGHQRVDAVTHGHELSAVRGTSMQRQRLLGIPTCAQHQTDPPGPIR